MGAAPRRRRRLAAVVKLLLALGAVTPLGPAGAQPPPRVERVEVHGLTRTRRRTLLELFPRELPSQLTDAELEEVARRIANLEIFDHVEVRREEDVVRVEVREKWTLIPLVDFATGTTLADTYALLGASEYNLMGTASSLGVEVYRERRGFGFHAILEEHVYRRRRWAFAGEVSYGSAAYRFDTGESWDVARAEGYLWTTSPPVGNDHLRYEAGLVYARETVAEGEGGLRPPSGQSVGSSMTLTWDGYEWNDLTPHGFVGYVSATLDTFFGPRLPQRRHRLDTELRAATILARDTVLMGRLRGNLLARGNPNHSVVLGSVDGVRGVEDSRYFNWVQGAVNLELRTALRLAQRWALQGVLFGDGALFEQLKADGSRGAAGQALSGGLGVRLVPTWLSDFVLRLDGARLALPERSWFYQIGVRQYF